VSRRIHLPKSSRAVGAVRPVGAVGVSETAEVSVTRVAHGVGGSYQEWQRTPPPHAVYMADHSGGWTTLTVYFEGSDIVKWVNGGVGPNNIPMAHDIDISELPEETAACIWAAIDTDLESSFGRGESG